MSGNGTLIKHDKEEGKRAAELSVDLSVPSTYMLHRTTDRSILKQGPSKQKNKGKAKCILKSGPIYSNKIATLAELHESYNLEYICITITKTIFCNKGPLSRRRLTQFSLASLKRQPSDNAAALWGKISQSRRITDKERG